jgi:DNA-binding CsgD family transcriptional regulator
VVSPQQEQEIRRWIASGRSDDHIAMALMISVKVVRVIRRDLEAAIRPRTRGER